MFSVVSFKAVTFVPSANKKNSVSFETLGKSFILEREQGPKIEPSEEHHEI